MSSKIQTLRTKNTEGIEEKIYPRSVFEAIVNQNTNQTLTEVLENINIPEINCVNGQVLSGRRSVAIGGTSNTVYAYDSVCMGGGNNVIGDSQNPNRSNGTCAIIASDGSIVIDQGIIIGGTNNTVSDKGAILSSQDSVVESGTNTIIIGGNHNHASNEQLVVGHFNKKANGASIGAGTDGTAFIIGNGAFTYASGAYEELRNNAFRVTYTGEVYGGAAYNSSGADYAEYAEWADGNLENEDRRGYFVTLIGNKIEKANAGDYILGVVSANPCVIGNSDEDWNGKYLRDEFGSAIFETCKECVEIEGVPTTVTVTSYKENPKYDKNKEYISRKNRCEWSAIGWIGVLAVRDDGTCKVDGYCKCSEGGIATHATNEEFLSKKFIYRVSERVGDNIIKIIIK